MVRLPLIGQVKAGGLTAHDLEGGITAALANGYLTVTARQRGGDDLSSRFMWWVRC